MKGHRTTLLSLALIGCGSLVDSPTPLPEFSVQVSGDIETAFAGSLRLVTDGGSYSEIIPQATEGPVTGLLLAELDPGRPQVFIGIIDDQLRPGTYQVHVAGTPVGAGPEFYATYTDAGQADGSRRVYEVTGGTVTITEVEPTLRGQFALESARYFLFPENAGPGTSVTGQPGTLAITGTLHPAGQ